MEGKRIYRVDKNLNKKENVKTNPKNISNIYIYILPPNFVVYMCRVLRSI